MKIIILIIFFLSSITTILFHSKFKKERGYLSEEEFLDGFSETLKDNDNTLSKIISTVKKNFRRLKFKKSTVSKD